MKDPYAVLGISPGATREDIKHAYHRLAKVHHPDRWSGKAISPEELHHHQETFKNITVAYHLLMENDPPVTDETPSTSWDDLWKRMEDVLKRRHVLEPLSHFLKMTFHHLRRPATDDAPSPTPTPSHEHSFTIPVTLEDIHQGKRKKVRLLLKNDPEPIYLSVMCDRYPSYETTIIRPDGTMHTLALVLYPKTHPTYTVDDVEPVDETSGFNLYRAIPMTLLDYVQGKHVEWIHLDGHPEHHWIPPFLGGGANFWKKVPQRGLMGKGDLYLTLDWRFPTEAQWTSLTPSEKDAFILILQHLTH